VNPRPGGGLGSASAPPGDGAALPLPALVIDFGVHTTAAVVVRPQGAWLVPDPASGTPLWASAIHWDGERFAVGALAEHRRRSDPRGFAAGFKRDVGRDAPVQLGARRFRPFEQVFELFSALRAEAQRRCGFELHRAVVTVPTGYGPGDPRRGRLIAAAEAAGLGPVELLAEPVAAACAPTGAPPPAPGDILLVYDLGADFQTGLVHIRDEEPELLGSATVDDWGGRGLDALIAAGLLTTVLDRTVACCRDLLARVGVPARAVTAVIAVGGWSRLRTVAPSVERGLGIKVSRLEEPELAVARGAAAWLPASGSRVIAAQPSPDRAVPLAFAIPGGSARLLAWLVAPTQSYLEGAALARVRLADGAVWELVAHDRGTLDQVLVGPGSAVSAGQWLALARV